MDVFLFPDAKLNSEFILKIFYPQEFYETKRQTQPIRLLLLQESNTIVSRILHVTLITEIIKS